MSLLLEMLQAARLSPKLLADATDRVEGFLRDQQASDGGFCDRAGQPDVYYDVFGLMSLASLDLINIAAPNPQSRVSDPEPRISHPASHIPHPASHLLSLSSNLDALDFVHLASLARAWRCAAGGAAAPFADVLRERALRWRAADGGFHNVDAGSNAGTPYGCYLALGMAEDLSVPLCRADELAESIRASRVADGSYANQPGLPVGSTTATAAAIGVLRVAGQLDDPEATTAWLRARAYARGGFFAAPKAPVPDLLSTATALHTLSALGADLRPLREPMLDFVDSLWSARGGFHGHWADDGIDCEYTFYALLALGHLATAE